MKNNLTALLLIISAQISFAQTFTSKNNPAQVWSDNATWVGGVAPNTSITGTVNIYGEVTQPGNLSVSNSGGSTLNVYNTLTVTGSFINNGAFTLHAGGILNAASFDNTNSGGTTATIGGALNISGSLTNSNDLTILAGAVVTVDDNYTNANSGAAALDVYGTLIVKGNFSTATNIRVRPTGLLIIVGDLTVTNAGAAEIINEGNTVVVGEVTTSGDITTGNQFYIFDDTPTYGWTANVDGTNWNGGNDNTLTNEFPTENDIPENIWDILDELGVGCAGNNAIAGTHITCMNSSVSLTGTAVGGASYLWESSTTSATTGFVTAAGTVSNQNYTTAALTQTTWFRRRVTKASPACTHYSQVIQVIVF